MNCPKCGHDIDFHTDLGCEFGVCGEAPEICNCSIDENDIESVAFGASRDNVMELLNQIDKLIRQVKEELS